MARLCNYMKQIMATPASLTAALLLWWKAAMARSVMCLLPPAQAQTQLSYYILPHTVIHHWRLHVKQLCG